MKLFLQICLLIPPYLSKIHLPQRFALPKSFRAYIHYSKFPFLNEKTFTMYESYALYKLSKTIIS
jgi:hypothetical protein